MRPLKIAMVGAKGLSMLPGGGGIENFVRETGARLVNRGHHVFVYTRPHYENIGFDFQGIELIPLPSINTKNLDTLTHTLFSSINALFRPYDVVHFHSVGTALFSLVPRLKGMKSLLHIHAPDWLMNKWGLFAKAYLKASNYPSAYFPNAVAVVSNVQQRYYSDKFGIMTHYIPGGINKFSYKKPNRIIEYGLGKRNFILFSAGLRHQKGCHYLIKAYKDLNTDLKLVIPGGSRHSDDYITYLKMLAGNDPHILFLGFVDPGTMEELYSNALIYVHPSEAEGLSHALQQAMAYGNCVVASDIPPNVEVVQKYGYYFKDKDYKDLTKILQELIHDSSLIKVKRQKAQAYICQKYNWDDIVTSLERVYRDLTQGRN